MMIKNTKISLIVARDLEDNIGIDNELPWRCKADLQHFRKLTTGKVCIMGRKTFESLPAPLKNRRVIIISANPTKELQSKVSDLNSHHLVESPEKALELALSYTVSDEIMICGGATIYKAFLEYLDKAYISVINTITQSIPGKTLVKLDLDIPKNVDVQYTYFNLEPTA